MVIKLFSIISLLLTVSCVSRLTREQELKKLKPFKLNKNTNNSVFNIIDTNFIYKPINDNTRLQYYSIIKFYTNGKVGSFVVYKNEKIERNTFNPKRADIGIYNYNNGNKIVVEFSTIRQGNKYLYRENVVCTKDTIKIIGEKSIGIFVKDKTIPKEWLEGWKPDW